MPNCDITHGVSLENLRAMVEAAWNYNRESYKVQTK